MYGRSDEIFVSQIVLLSFVTREDDNTASGG